ncbi:MAG TPA: hypothetical protein VNT77_03575 [Allosphingosinicella sp.]|nr:hypothetical protein [Allosphingosinicella sp.]
MKGLLITAAAAALLAACGGNEETTNNSGVTADEAAALNDMDNVMNVEPDSLVAVDDNGMGNGEVSSEEIAEAAETVDTGNNAANAQ